ncbi:MAG: 3-phosphoserine/phosphohydroxythreonine transaminase [Planctomycetota bacterium]|nr:3-phosphoserine/phosphohydroxythreonine transaminase [Planctomycetota bacterium]
MPMMASQMERSAGNYSAGPSRLPDEVRAMVAQDVLDLDGSGIGCLEHSHRGEVFDQVLSQTESLTRSVLGVPSEYSVLFLQGGATQQFGMIPMNFVGEGASAHTNTGVWTTKAIRAAEQFGPTTLVFDGSEDQFRSLPDPGALHIPQDASFFHTCANNTVMGTQWNRLPRPPAGVPHICDMSSEIGSRVLDWDNLDMLYAGCQKNLGVAGTVLVVIKNELLARSQAPTPFNYQEHALAGSRLNTPPTFGIVVLRRMLEWIQQHGGVQSMALRAQQRAQFLYEAIESTQGYWRAHASTESRSVMNITWHGPNPEAESQFLSQAKALGFSGLKGHRSVGGLRASVYNAADEAACEKLAELIQSSPRSSK